jgi:hypothetical protein
VLAVDRLARQVSDLMLDISARLNRSVSLVQETVSAEEFALYRRAVGRIMGDILLEVLNPLYRDHPGLKPDGL